jgi:hypothetical protein
MVKIPVSDGGLLYRARRNTNFLFDFEGIKE